MDASLNPIVHWAYSVCRVRKIPCFKDIWAIREDKLGLKGSKLVTHSNHSGVTMAMHLAGILHRGSDLNLIPGAGFGSQKRHTLLSAWLFFGTQQESGRVKSVGLRSNAADH
eukprot:15344597-Ditylum_brightwellii.AAC.1